MISALFSFAVLRKAPALLERIPPEWELFLDSGAFTNHQAGREVCKLEDYIAFCKEHGDRFAHRFNLDKIGDPDTSRRNLNAMLDAGLEVVPVFQRGSEFDELDALLEAHPVVGIGGIATSSRIGDGKEYLQAVIGHVGDARRMHLLGIGAKLIDRYRPFSADCTTWAAGRRWRNPRFYVRGEWVTVETRKHGRKRLLTDRRVRRALAAYGLEPRTIAADEAWSGAGVGVVAEARAWVRFARSRASAPSTRVVFACGSELDVQVIESAISAEGC